MRINLTGIPVRDQSAALAFYTEKLGFIKSKDVPMGGEHRWLTVVSKDSDEVELLLEPLGFAPAADFQKALYDAGIPYTSFESNDLQTEVQNLRERGVEFRGEIQSMDNVSMIIFDDTCGNLICLTQTSPN